MTQAAILLRTKWEDKSEKGISKLSKYHPVVLRTGDVFPENIDLVFRWGCTANVPIKSVVNQAKYIHLANNKTEFRKILHNNKLCPDTYFHLNGLLSGIIDGAINNDTWIVRPPTHSRGSDLVLCTSAGELCAAVKKLGSNSYISRKIEKVKEYRVLFVQGRVVQVVEKIPSSVEKLNWGLGTFVNIKWGSWPLHVVAAAQAAHGLSGLCFSAIDVIVDKNDHPYVLEANSAPELVGEYSQGVFAKAFDYIIEGESSDPLPITKEEGFTWKDLIHPALWKE